MRALLAIVALSLSACSADVTYPLTTERVQSADSGPHAAIEWWADETLTDADLIAASEAIEIWREATDSDLVALATEPGDRWLTRLSEQPESNPRAAALAALDGSIVLTPLGTPDRVDLVSVIAHEIGHHLAESGHLDSGLLAPSGDGRVWRCVDRALLDRVCSLHRCGPLAVSC